MERRGLMLVLSSPSGAGKTTITRALLQKDENVRLSVSVTTRPPRKNEIHGEDYFFEKTENFLKILNADGFLEHAKVFDNYYGTPKEPVEDMLSKGNDVLFDIDWQGTQQLQAKCPQDLVSIFILPPSKEILEERLRRRGMDSDEVINLRMADSLQQISHWPEYDYVIINYDLDKSIRQVESILYAERLKRHRQTGIFHFVNKMREG